METSIRYVMLVALPLAIGGMILAKPIIDLIFGAAYEQAWPTLSLLMFTILILFPGTLISNAIFAYDKQKSFIFSTGVGASANVVLDLILIPILGIAGSAVATIVAQSLVNTINLRTLKKIIHFKLSGMGKMFLASLGMGVLVFFLNWKSVHVLPNIFFGGLIYLIFLILLKEPILQKIWQKINFNQKNEISN
jgi:O-antigen/teichoic acid export membrane protein